MPQQVRLYLYIVGAAATGFGGFWLWHLETVPETGRIRFTYLSDDYVRNVSNGEYEKILREYNDRILPLDHPYTRMAQRVMRRLVPVSGMHDVEWEVRVINDPDEVNAFVIPGYGSLHL